MKNRHFLKGMLAASAAFLLSIASAFAQNLTVTGKVIDATGQPVIGAYVLVEGTSQGSSTDADGSYSIANVPSNATLVYSLIGMSTTSEPVNGRAVINVTMTEDTELLEETVVIGYGTIKKSDLTGAVSVVKTEDFQNRAITSVGDALQGAAAGVTVRSSGDLGGLPSIQIRGTGNLTNTDPLYIIDGIPTSNNVGFNPDDIATIQILKDASSAAIYGSRAANGVIIITTKSGQEGKTRIEYTNQTSIQSLRRLDFADGESWRNVMTAMYNQGNVIGSTTENPDFWKHDTDWQSEWMKTGVQQNHNLSVSGGSKYSKYRVSFSYLDNTGYNIGTGMNRFTTSANSEFTLGIVRIGESLQIGRHSRKTHLYNTLAQVVGITPIIPVYDDEYGKNGWGYGNRQFAYSNAYNVVAHADDANGSNNSLGMYLRGSVWGEVSIAKWLKYKLNLGVTLNNSESHNWTTGYNYAYGFTDITSSADASASNDWSYLVENTLNFDKKFGKHNVSAVVGQSYQDTQRRTIGAGTKTLIQSAGGLYLQNVSGGTVLNSATGDSSEYRLLSFFGRVNYDYAGRYLVQVTVRRDGTSRFAPGNQWGTFPSASLGWHISNEPFFNVSWINDLKLRANYGTLGSQNVGNYDYQSVMNSYTGYAFNGGLVLTPGQAITDASNYDISWEIKKTANIGLDMSFFNSRLQTSIEYYDSRSQDVLFKQAILKSVGSVSDPTVNSASLTNKGVELAVTWKDQINKDWSYSVSMNLSHNSNKLTGLGYGVDSYDQTTTLSKVGYPVGTYFLIKTQGIYQTDEEAKAHGVINNAHAGDIRYEDFSGDKTITNADRQLLEDKSPWPKLEASLNLNISYKNFSAQIFGFGQFFKWVYNGTRLTTDALSSQSQIRTAYAENVWSESNKHNNVWYPRTAWGYTMNDINYSDRWLERGDFFKFSTLSLAYNLKPKGAVGEVLHDVKLSVTAQNFLCLTGYTGWDPDFTAGMFTPGNAGNSTPSPRSIVFGVGLSF